MDKTLKKLIRQFKTTDPFIISVGLGINIRYADLGDQTRGIYYRKLRRRFIVIHENLDEYWQRFVCAHELGHDRLHPGVSRFWLDEQSFYNVGKFERQANRFAVRLLTADDPIKADETVEELFKRQGVPIELQQFYY
ncbi:ImmA/IrrE family metallo-endopeptidase [Paenibacillus planticolens]|uniref:ImmA/IrrE family metallo-endopeptidase n=1 Tax=Paenibacillus planticolens TaxID=2654976 RepID=A0ABX1ZNI6_9BACL|nr:ImmA/IrrE family metallo-endopeptidase [Paenibacillus planticolens]NOV01376.1 ImmA/IrrE family metallo-endopeptidase [Paenibacillus planticolens]